MLTRLPTVEELPSGPNEHGENDPAEEGSEEQQTDHEDQCRSSDVFDDRFTAVRHVLPARNQSHDDLRKRASPR